MYILSRYKNHNDVIRGAFISTVCCTVMLVSQSALAVLDPQTYTLTSSNPDGSNTWTYDVNQSSATGTIKFNDWGYTGPMGASVNTFEVAGGFDANKLGQIQSVMTVAPDYLTGDPNISVYTDNFGPATEMPNANMDSSVNFYRWGYTTPTSSFNNMQIDQPGNYFVPKDDMSFGFYDTFSYNTGTNTTGSVPVSDFDTAINFQPYAISDGIGWCGSTMVTNPNGVESMAGQITFDFAFDAYLFDGEPGGFPATQVVPGFVMRSYGDYYFDVNYTSADRDMIYEGHAVGNNMDPTTVNTIDPGLMDPATIGQGGTLDPAYQNQVSFLGGGVVPDGVWVSADSYDENGAPIRDTVDGTWDMTVVPEGTPGAVYHNNDFGGYAFLLRADAERTLEWISPDGHSDYVATDAAAYASLVPVPAAVWLFGSGLIGLFGIATKRKAA